MEDKNRSYILIVRHGERMDCNTSKTIDNNRFKFSLDPELTPTGLDAAYITGEHIKKEFIDKIEFDNVQVISSPFLRTLQTAGKIASAINLDNIEVSYGICEKLSFDYCEGSLPFDRMYACKQENRDDLEKNLGCRVNFEEDYKRELFVFPEKYDDCYSRFDLYYEKVIRDQKKSSMKNLIILVTHGIAIDICRKKFNNTEEIVIDYVCISALEVNKSDQSAILVYNAYNKHVERKKDFKLANNLYVI